SLRGPPRLPTRRSSDLEGAVQRRGPGLRPAFSSKYRRAGLRAAMGAAQPRAELLPAELLGPGVTGLADTDPLQVTVEDVPTVVVTGHPGVHDLFGAGLALGNGLR